MKKRLIQIGSFLLLGYSIVTLYADDPGTVSETICQGTCPTSSALPNIRGGWGCGDYECETPSDVTVHQCTDCIVNEATAHYPRPECRCKIEPVMP